MGRYDKIKVYSSGAWHTPSRIRVYQNGWQDLGTFDSYNTKTMKVRSGSSFQRCTLNRRDQTVVTDRYAKGRFNLLPSSGYCRCSKSSNAGNYNWYFRATVEKTTDTDQYLFYCGTGGSPNSPGSHYARITWLANGKIRVESCYNGSVSSMTSSNAVMKDTQVYLNVYSNKGSYTNYIVFTSSLVYISSNKSARFLFVPSTNTDSKVLNGKNGCLFLSFNKRIGYKAIFIISFLYS